MNYIEKFYSTDKIDQSTYKNEITKLLEKYSKFSQITPNFNLADFEKKYNIPHEEISWAKYVIEKGVEVRDALLRDRDNRPKRPSSTCRPQPPSLRSMRLSTWLPTTQISGRSDHPSRSFTSS